MLMNIVRQFEKRTGRTLKDRERGILEELVADILSEKVVLRQRKDDAVERAEKAEEKVDG